MDPTSTSFYGTREWRRLANRMVRLWIANDWPCHVCGQPVTDRKGATVDHIIPRRQRPDLALEPSNLRVMHRGCHSRHTHRRKPQHDWTDWLA